MNTDISINVDNLSKRYSKLSAIKEVNLLLKENCPILGPNGAGKSTTLRILDVHWFWIGSSSGISVAENSLAIDERLASQESNPLGKLRVSEYLKLRAELKKFLKPFQLKCVESWIYAIYFEPPEEKLSDPIQGL